MDDTVVAGARPQERHERIRECRAAVRERLGECDYAPFSHRFLLVAELSEVPRDHRLRSELPLYWEDDRFAPAFPARIDSCVEWLELTAGSLDGLDSWTRDDPRFDDLWSEGHRGRGNSAAAAVRDAFRLVEAFRKAGIVDLPREPDTPRGGWTPHEAAKKLRHVIDAITAGRNERQPNPARQGRRPPTAACGSARAEWAALATEVRELVLEFPHARERFRQEVENWSDSVLERLPAMNALHAEGRNAGAEDADGLPEGLFKSDRGPLSPTEEYAAVAMVHDQFGTFEKLAPDEVSQGEPWIVEKVFLAEAGEEQRVLVRGYLASVRQALLGAIPEPVPTADAAAGKRSRRKSSGVRIDRSKLELTKSALERHHRVWHDDFNFEPITTRGVKRETDGHVSSATASRLIIAWFGSNEAYKAACKDGTIRERLMVLSGRALNSIDPAKVDASIVSRHNE